MTGACCFALAPASATLAAGVLSVLASSQRPADFSRPFCAPKKSWSPRAGRVQRSGPPGRLPLRGGPISYRHGFGPTTMRNVPAPSNRGAQNTRLVGRPSGSGILPIWTNRRSPSGAPSPLRCRRELIPIPPGQGLCQASARSSGERQQQGVLIAFLPDRHFRAARTARASPKVACS